MSDSPFPSDGDLVVHCGHADGACHFWASRSPWLVTEETLAGTSIMRAYWMCACDRCFAGADGDPKKIQLRGHGFWAGRHAAAKPN